MKRFSIRQQSDVLQVVDILTLFHICPFINLKKKNNNFNICNLIYIILFIIFHCSGLANVDERIDENINDNDNDEKQRIMRTLDDYLVPHASSVALQSPNISFSTLDALENAEKLVQEAKRKIIEASYNIPIVDYDAERYEINDFFCIYSFI